MALRIRRLCSTIQHFDKHAANLENYLTLRGYKASVIRTALEKARSTSSSSLLSPKPRKSTNQIPFVSQYHPKLPHYSEILNKFQYILHNDDHLKKIFPNPPLISYRKCPTLRDLLVKSELREENFTKTQPIFNPCMRKGCTTCLHSSKTKDSFKSTNTDLNYNLNTAMNCNSTNLVYMITCNKCGKQYVGETGRQLKTRFTEHLNDVSKKKDTAVADHFNLPGHTKSNMEIVPIEKLNKCTFYRRHKESHWIKSLKTLHPHGLNLFE